MKMISPVARGKLAGLDFIALFAAAFCFMK